MQSISKKVFPIYAIALIVVLSLSTAHKGIHDFIFHWDTPLTQSVGQSCGAHGSNEVLTCSHKVPSPTQNHSDGDSDSSSDSGCDSLLCPVSIFAQGLETFDAICNVPPILIAIEGNALHRIENPNYQALNSPYFVRGPPSLLLKA